MEDKIKIMILAIGLAVALILGGFIAGWSLRGNNCSGGTVEHDTIVMHHTDTFMLPSPPDTVIETKYKTVHVPYYITDTDTVHDSILVMLPYEQHFAKIDTVADIWYSGYDAKIDSARVYKYQTTQIVNHYITNTRHNFVGVAGGLSDASLIYMYDFGRFAIGASAGYTYKGQPTVKAVAGIKF